MLQLLRSFDSLSRADLARESELSEGTVSRIAVELLRQRLICEDGAESSTGGRPGTRLRLGEQHVGIGVDIQKQEMQFAVATLAGKFLDTSSLETPKGAKETLRVVGQEVNRIKKKLSRKTVEGVGVSVSGLVNSRSGVVEFGNFPGWVGIAVKEQLQQMIKLPVQVDNNVRLAAIAEYNYGSLLEVRNSHCLLFALVEDGIGIGLVLDGKLYYGPRDAAGEFGQMVIADSGDSEGMDRTGCLEKLASSTALCDTYAALTSKRALPGSHNSRTRVRKICQLAISGDKAAGKALRKTCRYLGIGLANVIWGLDADAVVIDTPMNEAWPLVVSLIREQFPKGEDIVTFRNLPIRPSSLGGRAAILGASTLAVQTLFTSVEKNRDQGQGPRRKP